MYRKEWGSIWKELSWLRISSVQHFGIGPFRSRMEHALLLGKYYKNIIHLVNNSANIRAGLGILNQIVLIRAFLSFGKLIGCPLWSHWAPCEQNSRTIMVWKTEGHLWADLPSHWGPAGNTVSRADKAKHRPSTDMICSLDFDENKIKENLL